MVKPASPWPAVLLLYAAGLMAAAQLGKLSALAPVFTPALGLTLAGAAWAISLLEVGGATLGAVAGLLAQRWGLRRTLQGGLVALALAGLGSATAQGQASLLGWRLLEAAGYLSVTVTAPVLIARLSLAAGAHTQMLAMTLWSTFVPVGLALGASGAAAAALPLGWRGALLAGGVLAAVLAVAMRWRWPAAAEAAADAADAEREAAHRAESHHAEDSAAFHAATRRAARPGMAAWCLALGFGLFALFEVGLLGLLPTLLVEQAGLSAAAAGQWTGVASLAAVGGSGIAALLQRHAVPARWPALLALALPAVLLWGIFRPAPDAAWAVGLAIACNLLGGVFASYAFAMLPRVAPRPAQLVRVNGLITQCGASGSLLGPPLMAAGVAWGGWTGAAALGVLITLPALPLAWRAFRGR
ncbi:MFS transporter [Ideonella sp. DXS22W]|uniref:MFS transporter n=1 Tax=Pseudaquabacterium inlustre TaxID=2984192 RepID=A0ABU9CK43_9BURK